MWEGTVAAASWACKNLKIYAPDNGNVNIAILDRQMHAPDNIDANIRELGMLTC